MTPRAKEILSWYGADNVGTLTNLARLLNHGRLAGTGKLVDFAGRSGLRTWAGALIRPQSPSLQSALSPRARDRSRLQCVRCSAGLLGSRRPRLRGEIPLILKTNDNDVLREEKDPNQALTASVQDALRLGCCADRLHDLPGIGAPARNVRTASRVCRRGKAQRARGRHLVLSARVGSEQGRRISRSTLSVTLSRSRLSSERTSSR